jgi:predicted  nucleic acid-binding Zn-ribbon protein
MLLAFGTVASSNVFAVEPNNSNPGQRNRPSENDSEKWEGQPNVVLGRELILLTKLVEDASRSEQELISIRSDIAEAASPFLRTYRRLETSTALKTEVERLKSFCEPIREQIEGLREKLAALPDPPKIVTLELDPQKIVALELDPQMAASKPSAPAPQSGGFDDLLREVSTIERTLRFENSTLEEFPDRVRTVSRYLENRQSRLEVTRRQLDGVRGLVVALKSAGQTYKSDGNTYNSNIYGDAVESRTQFPELEQIPFPVGVGGPGVSPDTTPNPRAEVTSKLDSVGERLNRLQEELTAVISDADGVLELWTATLTAATALSVDADQIQTDLSDQSEALRKRKDALEHAMRG